MPSKLNLAGSVGKLDEKWLARCAMEPIHKMEGLSCVRLVDGDEHWEAIVTSLDSAHSCNLLERYFSMKLSSTWAVVPSTLIRSSDQMVLVFEQHSNLPIEFRQFDSMLNALETCISAARAVCHSHSHGVIHGNLGTNAIVFTGGKARLHWLCPLTAVDESQSQYQISFNTPPELLNGTTDRKDIRSDIYALGLVFYEWITGKTPHTASSPEEWRHAHLAVSPAAPSSVSNDIPNTLSNIIMKSLEKDPRNRYQSAESLLHDLIRLAENPCQDNGENLFQIGLSDPPILDESSCETYGRDYEIEMLSGMFIKASERPIFQIALVNGPTGSGKTAFVKKFLSELVGGQSASGKAEQLKQNIPYSTISELLTSIANDLLGYPTEDLLEVRQKLLGAISNQGHLLTTLSPDFKFVIGDAASPEDMPSLATIHRNNTILVKAFSALATPERPLILFFDDLQWADESTKELISTFAEQKPSNISLILAYRSDIQENGTQFIKYINNIKKMCSLSIEVGPIPACSVATILAKRLKTSESEVTLVANLIHEKTLGNAFFVRQVIRSLIDEKIFRYDSSTQKWLWSLDEVSAYRYADNVADLMLWKFKKLYSDQKEILKLLSCLGTSCEIALAAHIADLEVAEMLALTSPLVSMGLLKIVKSSYTFPHQRILDAAYDQLSENLRSQLHKKIAKKMIDYKNPHQRSNAFAIANQLLKIETQDVSIGDHIPGEALVIAAKNATQTAAYEQAAQYLCKSRDLLCAHCWTHNYSHALETYLLSAECELQLGNIDNAKGYIDVCLQRSQRPLDTAKSFHLKSSICTLQSDYQSTIKFALKGLEHCGISLHQNPDLDEMHKAFQITDRLLKNYELDDLLRLPTCHSEWVNVAMKLLSNLICSFFVDNLISFTHLAKMVELTLLHGVTPEASHGLSWYAVKLGEHYGLYDYGSELAATALKLVQEHSYDVTLTSTLVACDQMFGWTHPIDHALRHARRAQERGAIGGDIGMSCYAWKHVTCGLLFRGGNLAAAAEEIDRGIAFVRSYGFSDIERILQAQAYYCETLMKGISATSPSVRASFDSALPGTQSAPSGLVAAMTAIYEGMCALAFGDPAQARKIYRDNALNARGLRGHIAHTEYQLWYCLAQCTDPSPAPEIVRELEEIRARFAHLSEINPTTFKHKHMLIEGSLALRQGQDLLAISFFDQAAINAGAGGFIHEKALAHEFLAGMCEAHGLISGAHYRWRAARDAYRIWGAEGKAQLIELSHHFLSTEAEIIERENGNKSNLDLSISIKATQALSDEVLQDRLVETLIRNLIIYAGASKGALLLTADSSLTVEALAKVEGGSVLISHAKCGMTADIVPASLIYATMRKRRTIVIDDAMTDCPDGFKADLKGRQIRSVICLPLLRQGTITGLVYLENASLAGVFSPERVPLLELLTAQAAVSVETAKLYARLVEVNHIRANIEAELANSKSELSKASNSAVMGELSAAIAHEISQPLSAMENNAKASLNWLKMDPPNVEYAIASLEDISLDATRTAEIVQGLRSLAKKASPDLSPVNLSLVIRDVSRLTSNELLSNNVELILFLQPDCIVMADALQLRQVFYNLVMNANEALKGYTRTDRKIAITTRSFSEYVEISVDDNGPGIDKANIESVFEPFFTTKSTGLGMGLSICRSVIDAHGGTITIDTNEYGGCRIGITFCVSSLTE
ncbi:ATP-binding sensor histidine kinase [Pseudomonas sp. PP3]|uniref:trifunctional serine/threonine-protein kinase/ATP-binding protein/sensor histidine kinase n=1 Tax=Pseudomonas sp. PP3 TaxID=2815936 RepID=UPI001BAFDB65|nr:ATP-binding sensor histidine kinase [Pseudomonas sp. PP3]